MDAIKKMLEVNPDPEDGAKATSKVRNFFKSCLAKESEPTDEFMKSEIEKVGGWRWIGDNSSLNFQQRVGKSRIADVFTSINYDRLVIFQLKTSNFFLG